MVDIVTNSDSGFDPWFARELVCPRDKSDLRRDGERLVCRQLHTYPIIDDIPIMLVDDVPQTLPDLTQRSFGAIAEGAETVANGDIDAFVQKTIVGTNGNLYGQIAGRLPRYPIPELRLPPARDGARDLLDLGCNWGRWSIAAARRGYRPVGMDPGLESIRPARRIARQLGVEARFLVGDARYIPFREGRFDVVYSYGVLQHFSPYDAKLAIAEAAQSPRAERRRTDPDGGAIRIALYVPAGAARFSRRARFRGALLEALRHRRRISPPGRSDHAFGRWLPHP